MVAKPPPFRFTVNEYERMIATGILTEHDRVVLIRGEVVAKMPIGGPHSQRVNALTKLFVQRVADDVTVAVQNPIVLADSEPEPDLALLDASYPTRRAKPTPSDVRLLIEVADTSPSGPWATRPSCMPRTAFRNTGSSISPTTASTSTAARNPAVPGRRSRSTAAG